MLVLVRYKRTLAESADWGRFPESVGDNPHLSGARGVGRSLQDGFELDTSLSQWTGLVVMHKIHE